MIFLSNKVNFVLNAMLNKNILFKIHQSLIKTFYNAHYSETVFIFYSSFFILHWHKTDEYWSKFSDRRTLSHRFKREMVF